MTDLEGEPGKAATLVTHDSREFLFTNRHLGGLKLGSEGLGCPLLGHFRPLYPGLRPT